MPRFEPEIAALAELTARPPVPRTPAEEQQRVYVEIMGLLDSSNMPNGTAISVLCYIAGKVARHAGLDALELARLNLGAVIESGRAA
jgi:hypothetical protein